MTKILNFVPSADGKVLDITLYGILFGDWFTGSEEEQAMSAIRGVSPDTEIRVHINSDGGDTMAGVAFYNVLAAHPGPVVCLVEGLAASAASIVAMAGRTVMGRGTMMMVHNPWSIIAGGAEDLRAQADLLDKVLDAVATIYEKKTGKSLDEIKALLEKETWMGAEEAVAAGFADEVAGDEPQVTADSANDGTLNLITFSSRNGKVAYPRERMPARIVAMAKAPPSPAAPPEPRAITRNLLAEEAPVLLAQLLEEGRAEARTQLEQDHAAAIAALKEEHAAALAQANPEAHKAVALAERARLEAFEKIAVTDATRAIIYAAKFGPTPRSAADVGLECLLAQQAANLAEHPLLAARRLESKSIAGIVPAAPVNTQDAEREEAKKIAALANSRRGGSR